MGDEIHRRRAVGPDPDRMRGLPLPLAYIEMVVARGAPPIHALRGLAGNEAAILPEIFARACAPPAVQAVDHSCRDATRFQDQPGHGSRKRTALSGCAIDCAD